MFARSGVHEAPPHPSMRVPNAVDDLLLTMAVCLGVDGLHTVSWGFCWCAGSFVDATDPVDGAHTM